MAIKVEVQHRNNMAFEAHVNNHKLVMDADSTVGGNDEGPRPKPLLLASLGGCTGMDVVSILKKMRIEPEYFNMVIEADQTEEHPKVYSRIHITYEFRGNNLDPEKLQKAVELSQERYCGVSAMLKKATDLSFEIRILD